MSTPWDDLIRLIHKVWSSTRAITTKSDFSRDWANEIAEAARRGLITTQVTPHVELYGNQWKATLKGLRYLDELTEGMTPEAIQELLGIHVEDAFTQEYLPGEPGKDRPD